MKYVYVANFFGLDDDYTICFESKDALQKGIEAFIALPEHSDLIPRYFEDGLELHYNDRVYAEMTWSKVKFVS